MALIALLVSTSVVYSITLDTDDQNVEDHYENPVRTSDEDEIKNLPGLNDAIDFRQFSGYLNADTGGKKYLHYWFVESQTQPDTSPLLLWLNGGPGCSSLAGLFGELGPFEVNDDGETLKLRQFSWNKAANVLFLESPPGVGFSYSKGLFNLHTDDTTALENYHALKSFMKKFPQYKDRPLFLSGESYAGVYLPTLGVLVDDDPSFNLRGIAIGNGYLDVAKLSDSLIFFAYHHGFIGKSSWTKVSKFCCNGQPPAREVCHLSGSNSSWPCALVVKEITTNLMLTGVNPYNVYADCKHPPSKMNSVESRPASGLGANSRHLVRKALMRMTLDSATSPNPRPYHIFNATDMRHVHEEPPCEDDHSLIKYLNKPSVRSALHIPKKVQSWDICSLLVYVVKYPKLPGGLAPQMKKLINSKRDLALLVYNGDVDAVCNFLGDEWFVDDLGRKVAIDYKPWKVGKQIAGWVKAYDGISFATVRGSGHMVPEDRPREALAMISAVLNSKNKTIVL